MGTTGKRRIGRALTLVVGAAAIALPLFSAAPASAAPPPTSPIADSDTATLSSFPDTIQMKVDQLDPLFVEELTKVTITATVAGGVEGEITNLSATRAKDVESSTDVGISVTDSGILEPLVAEASETRTITVGPGATEPAGLSASDSTVMEITTFTPALEGLLFGTGKVVLDVTSFVNTSVSGPAPFESTGVASGEATLDVVYEFVPKEVCEYDDSLPAGHPDCEPPPPPECVDVTKIDSLPDPLVTGATYISDDGVVELTVDALHDDKSFDWSSNVEIVWMYVKGGQGGEPGDVLTDSSHEFFDYSPGATSGTAHAPLNDNTATVGDYYAASHIHVCYLPPQDACPELEGVQADPQDCEPPPPPECVDVTKIDSLPDPLVTGATYISDDGVVELTVDALHDDKSFDWSSNVEIVWMYVKGGQGGEPGDVLTDSSHEFFDYSPGATSGTAHAPLNDNTATVGDYYAASHLHVCYVPESEDPEQSSSPNGNAAGDSGRSDDRGNRGGTEPKSQATQQEQAEQPAPPPEPEPQDESEPKDEPVPKPEPEVKEPEPPANEEKAKQEDDSEGDGDDQDDKDGRAGTAGETGETGEDAGSEGEGAQ